MQLLTVYNLLQNHLQMKKKQGPCFETLFWFFVSQGIYEC